MHKTRLEAFSDGVLAIILTIMVLELKVPHDLNVETLSELFPVFVSYVLSFVYIGIYWNNHHHMISTLREVNGAILWANLHLLFWLSLVPFTTGLIGEHLFAPLAMRLYGMVLLMAAIAYYILQQTIIKKEGTDSVLAKAIVGNDLKGKISPLLYLTAIGASFFSVWVSGGVYVLVAIMWIVPDRRIEKKKT
ncbi:MAG: DUF1211 domain-containing protein [Bacteroidetes bacterium]|nr:DUF1211 domain-containing protein [Bacteroidota bacterium]